MKKNILLFLFLVIATSCATSRKKCIEKYCSQDTITTLVVVHDTIITERVSKDTVFSTIVDTVILTKDKLTIKYIKFRDSVYLSGQYEADTIVRVDTIQVSVPVICPELSTWEHVKEIPWWWWILALFVAGFAVWVWLKNPR